MAETVRAENYISRQEELAGWKVGIVSYKLGDRWYCEIDNVSPGARLTRRDGPTREEAEKQALDRAREMLQRTKVHPT
jgi:hypothetical protein